MAISDDKYFKILETEGELSNRWFHTHKNQMKLLLSRKCTLKEAKRMYEYFIEEEAEDESKEANFNGWKNI